MSRELREKREKNWFWIDNALIDRTDLNLYEKMLYICLARHTGGKDYAFPSLELLCKELGIKDKRTVVKYIKNLIEKGLVEADKSKGKVNVYYLFNVEEVVTSNVPTSKVPTSNATTQASNVTRVVTSNVPSSSDISCYYNKTNIKKTNINKTTADIDNINNIDPDSSSDFDLIKKLLEQHGITAGTIINILELVKINNISLNRVKAVLLTAPVKKWGEGAIYKALKENWAAVETQETFDESKAIKRLNNVFDYYYAGVVNGFYKPAAAQQKFAVECEKYKELELFKKLFDTLGKI